MEIELVIEAGKLITPQFQETLNNSVVLGAMVVLVLIMIFALKQNKIIFFGIVLSVGVTYIMFTINEENIYDKKRNAWIENYVIPYTETLTTQKLEVLEYSINYGGNTIKKNTIGKFENTNETKITIENNNKKAEYTGHMQVIRGDFDTMYIRYIELPSNLGNGLKKGWYNIKLYLPK